MSKIYKRYLYNQLKTEFKYYDVLFIVGARYIGKSFLIQEFLTQLKLENNYDNKIYNLFNNADYQIATSGDLFEVEEKIIFIDEIQMYPELIKTIKIFVDNQNKQYLKKEITQEELKKIIISGSNSQFLEEVDASTGRIKEFKLLPLTQTEILDSKFNFIDWIIQDITYRPKKQLTTLDIKSAISNGGYPAILNQENKSSQYNNYLNQTINKDIKSIANIHNSDLLKNLFKLLATQPACELNFNKLASQLQTNKMTISNYYGLLDKTFLLTSLPGWNKAPIKSLKNSKKYYLLDNGFITKQAINDSSLFGHVFENFVVTEILKQSLFSEYFNKMDVDLLNFENFYHFQTEYKEYNNKLGQKIKYNHEIDLLIQDNQNKFVLIEIKSRNKVIPDDFKHINYFIKTFPDKYNKAIIIYQGEEFMNFGNNKYAIPVRYLW